MQLDKAQKLEKTIDNLLKQYDKAEKKNDHVTLVSVSQQIVEVLNQFDNNEIQLSTSVQ